MFKSYEKIYYYINISSKFKYILSLINKNIYFIILQKILKTIFYLYYNEVN